jgi:hypothetical protein
MEINPQIKAILKGCDVNMDYALLYLLSLQYGLNGSGAIPEEIVRKVALAKIVTKDYATNTLTWHIPLFSGTEAGAFDWVTDWLQPFNQIGKQRLTPSLTTTCVKRMKEWFAKNPEYRKDDVYAARDLYFRTEQPSGKFVKTSYKFIQEGDISMLTIWCERVKEQRGAHKSGTAMFKGKIM